MEPTKLRVFIQDQNLSTLVLGINLDSTVDEPYRIFCMSSLWAHREFRSTYHGDGITRIHIGKNRKNCKNSERGPLLARPDQLKAPVFLGSWSGLRGPLRRGDKPKAGRHRLNFVLGTNEFAGISGWAVDGWVLGTDTVPAEFLGERYSIDRQVLSSCHADAELGLLAVVWTFSTEIWAKLGEISGMGPSIGFNQQGKPFVIYSDADVVRGNPYDRIRYAHKGEGGSWIVGEMLAPADSMTASDWLGSIGKDISGRTRLLALDPDGNIKELALPD